MHKDIVPPMVTKTVVGVDPDTKVTGWAMVTDGKVTAVGVVDIREKGLRGQEAAAYMSKVLTHVLIRMPEVDLGVVEGQQVYRGSKVDANGLLKVAAVSGAALGALGLRSHLLEFPTPRMWKGQTPKGAHHARILNDQGWEFEFQGPKKPPKITSVPDHVKIVGPEIPVGHWKEVVDAMGLALWGWKKHQ